MIPLVPFPVSHWEAAKESIRLLLMRGGYVQGDFVFPHRKYEPGRPNPWYGYFSRDDPAAKMEGRAVPERNYYLVLGVSREETSEEIRNAFRRLVKRYHPDLVGLKWINRFKDVVEAYEVLSDPVRREDYNQALEKGEVQPQPSMMKFTGSSPMAREPLFRRPMSVMRDFQSANAPWDELLDRFFRNFYQQSTPKAEQPGSLTVEIILSPEEALTGGRLPLGIPGVHDCPYCDGTGEIWPFRCTACAGQGRMEYEETVWLTIPARVGNGAVFEIPLKGLGIHNLYLRVLTRISGQ